MAQVQAGEPAARFCSRGRTRGALLFRGTSMSTAMADKADDCNDVVIACGDEDMHASSVVLRLASPVFSAMFTSEMKESQSGRVTVDIGTKNEFEEFYRFLHPATS